MRNTRCWSATLSLAVVGRIPGRWIAGARADYRAWDRSRDRGHTRLGWAQALRAPLASGVRS